MSNAIKELSRDEARSVLKPLLETVAVNFRCSAITHDNARKILGPERFARLLKDAIRGRGPVEKTFYAWNVEDYLVHPDLNAGDA